MKKATQILACMLVIAVTQFTLAQEKVQAVKKEYFTKQLELTQDEADKFWPIYNELEKKMKTLRKERHALAKEIKEEADNLSEDQLKTKVNTMLDNEAAEIRLRKEYFPKMGDAIGYSKASKLPAIERQFKRELLSKLKEERGGEGNRPPRPMRP